MVDPRTLLPLDGDTILRSVEKTGRAVIVHEAPVPANRNAERTYYLPDAGKIVEAVQGLF